jgi:transcriptional regulator with XRE-family HTH domain
VRLGQELRKVREDAGIGMRDLAKDLDVNSGRLSKKESGKLPAKKSDVDDYLSACNVHDPRKRDDLYKICSDVLQKGWWDGYAEDIAGTLMDRIWLESKATSIKTFEVIAIPGLLQIPQYAEALMRLRRPDASPTDIQRWLEVRTTRQHILTRHNPVSFLAIIDEATLRRSVANRQAMREQLDYLLRAADQSNVEIRVLPFSAGMHVSLTGSFEVLTLEPPYPEAGLLQVPGGDVCVEGDTIDVLTENFDHLLDDTLNPISSKKLIATTKDQL